MDLEHHLGPQILLLERRVDADHRDLDQVGGRTLQRRVGSRALTERANAEVAVAELGDVAAPAKKRLHESLLAGLLDCTIQPRAYARKALEVLFDERLRFLERDSQLTRQRQRSLTVNCG